MFTPCKAPWCRLAIWLIVGVIVLLLLLVLIALTIFGSHPCAGALDGCDAFKAICASYNGDHQFFYSHCDMLRENCLTGSGELLAYIAFKRHTLYFLFSPPLLTLFCARLRALWWLIVFRRYAFAFEFIYRLATRSLQSLQCKSLVEKECSIHVAISWVVVNWTLLIDNHNKIPMCSFQRLQFV